MAITTGTLVLDETSGIQSPGGAADDGDANNNDFGVGSLAGITVPAPLNSILAAALNEGGDAQALDPATTTVALSGATAADPDGDEILDFTSLGSTPIVDVRFSQDTNGSGDGGDPLDGTVTAKFLDPTDGDAEKDLLTADGFKIYLWPSGISNDAVIGRKATAGGASDPDGDIVFLAYLDTNTISGDPATEELDAGATGAKVWLVEFEPLQHPDGTDPDDPVSISNLFVTVDQFSSFSLEGAPSGQNLFLMFGDGTPGVDENGDPADEVSIVVTATNAVNQSGPNPDPAQTGDDISITTGGTVNTGQGGGGTTLGHTNQMIDPTEALAFTFVTGSNRDYTVATDHSLDLDQNGNADYLDQNEADVENNIQFTGLHSTTGATFTIVQLQNDKAATLTISASNADFAPAGGYIDELKLFDDGFVNINYVKVSLQKKVGNDIVPVIDPGDPQDPDDDTPVFTEFFKPAGATTIVDSVTGVTVKFNADGTATLEGVEALDVIEYHTAEAHSRVVIANSAVNPGNQSHIDAAFDIGQFSLRSSETVTEPFAALVFEDDAPTADLTDNGGAVTIDETAANQDDDDDSAATLFAGVAAPLGTDLSPTEYAISTTALVDASASAFGNDGAALTDSLVLSLQIGGIDGVDDGNGTDSGLTTTDGTAIFLYYEGDLIVGRYDADDDGDTGTDGNETAAFAIALKQDGNVAVAQYVSLTHGTPGDGTTPAGSYDEAVDLAGKVNAVVTATDADGDTHTDFVAIGDDINFEDDGPDADIADGGGSVTIDETAGVDADDDDVLGTATLGGVVLTTVFNGVANKGSDGAAFAQYALSDTSLADTSASDAGQDDEGATTVLSLEVANATSGLQTTDGWNIVLFKEGDLIVGRYDTANGAVTGSDPAAFAIAIDQDGNAAIAQYVSLTHGDAPSNYDEAVDLTGKVDMKVVVTDGDGDTSDDSMDIGDQLIFEDDGPSADIVDAAGSVTLDETAGDDGADDTAGSTLLDGVALTTVFNTTNVPNPGSDGAGLPQYALSAAPLASTAGSSFGQDDEGGTKVLSLMVADSDSELLTTAGDAITLFKEGALIVGRYDSDGDLDVDGDDDAAFAIALGQDGKVATVQYVSLTHNTPGDGTTPAGSHDEEVDLDGKVDMKVLVTDGDGDTSEDTVAIGNDINFEDDGPSADIADAAGSVTIDETAGVDADDDDVLGTATLGGVVLTTVFNSTNVPNPGADGADLPQYALSDAPLVSTTLSSFGQDDEGGTKVLSLVVADSDSDLFTTGGDAITLVKEGELIVGRYETDGVGGITSADAAAFAIALGQDGKVATAQYVSLTHNSAGDGTTPAGSFDEQVDLTGKVDAKVVVTDGDGDTSEDTVAIGNDINFEDDGPATSANSTVLLDDDALGGNAGGTGDDANAANVSGTLGHAFGQDDEDATVAYLTTGAPSGFTYEASGTSLLVKQQQGASQVTILTLTMVAATGAYTVTQNNSILHAAGLDENNQTFTINYRVTDGDGDTADGTVGIDVDDDTPVVTAKSNLVYANASNPPPGGDPGGTGVFAYSIGADDRTGTTYSATNSDFVSPITLTGTVGATAITGTSVVWVSETDSQAVFDVNYSYVSNNPVAGALTVIDTETATLTFDKLAGTYTLNIPEIESFSILHTSTPGNPLQGYVLNSAVTQGSNPPVSVMTLDTNFFVQFEGFGVINGTPQTFAYDATTGLFSNDRRYVTVSSASIGAASDTLQSDEVIDLDFFIANPQGFVNSAIPKATSRAVTITMEQVGPGAGKDLLVVLKLVNENNPADTINRTFIVGNSNGNDDIINASLPAYGFTAAKQNGIVVFESNDYNFVVNNTLETYTIQGAQVVTSTQGLSGSGYNLNGAIDDPATQAIEGGTTNTLVAFGGDTTEGNNEPIKIIDLGFVASTTPDAHLVFNVAVKDADGDATGSQTLDVTIVGGNAVTASGNADTFLIGDTDVDGLLSMVMTVIDGGFTSGIDKLNFSVAGSGTNYAKNLVAASSVAAFTAAADTALAGDVKYYFGVVGANGYLAMDGDGIGITAIVELVGVTDMAATDIS